MGLSLASFLRFWAVAASKNSSRAPRGPRSRRRPEPEDALEVSEQHLELLASVPRAFIGRREGKCPGHVVGVFVEVARDLARGCVRAALGLERTSIAVALAGPIDARALLGDAGAWGGIGAVELHQVLALRAGIAIQLGIEDEVASR
jgi:hypothetical protein